MENGSDNNLNKISPVIMIESNANIITAKSGATTVFARSKINTQPPAQVDVNGNPIMNYVDANGNPISDVNVIYSNDDPSTEMHQITVKGLKGGNVVINKGVHVIFSELLGTAEETIESFVTHGRATFPKNEHACLMEQPVLMPTGIIDLPNNNYGFNTLYGSETPEILCLAQKFSNINLLVEVSSEAASHIIEDALPMIGEVPVDLSL